MHSIENFFNNDFYCFKKIFYNDYRYKSDIEVIIIVELRVVIVGLSSVRKKSSRAERLNFEYFFGRLPSGGIVISKFKPEGPSRGVRSVAKSTAVFTSTATRVAWLAPNFIFVARPFYTSKPLAETR